MLYGGCIIDTRAYYINPAVPRAYKTYSLKHIGNKRMNIPAHVRELNEKLIS